MKAQRTTPSRPERTQRMLGGGHHGVESLPCNRLNPKRSATAAMHDVWDGFGVLLTA